MNLLEGFTSFNFEEGAPYVSVTKNGVTFNKSVIMKLNYPNYVVLLINAAEKKIALQSCDPSTPNSIVFYKGKDDASKPLSVRWNAKDLLQTLSRMMEWDLEMKSYRIYGEPLPENKAMLFDLNTATVLK